jgi:hypothetical protein
MVEEDDQCIMRKLITCAKEEEKEVKED